MIYALMVDGFEEIEALSFVDILRRAELDIQLVSVNGNKVIKGAEIKESYDMLFLPGGYPGYVNLENSKEVIDLLHKAVVSDKYIAAICAAPSVLGKEGILNGHKACCFPSFEENLLGADVVFDDVVVSGKIITSRGAGTAHKLGFEVVSLYKGNEFAEELAKTMLFI